MQNKEKNKKRVVIVEDDRLLAIVLKKMALSLNFEVLEISSTGEDAVTAVKEHQPDIVFMDIFLAGEISGIDAMKQIRSYSDVPCIYITAQSDHAIRKQAAEVDNSYYMLKPVNMMELQSAVTGVENFAA